MSVGWLVSRSYACNIKNYRAGRGLVVVVLFVFITVVRSVGRGGCTVYCSAQSVGRCTAHCSARSVVVISYILKCSVGSGQSLHCAL